MKISEIGIKGCLGIKELDFNPGKITLIEGASGAGKSSILESLKKFFTNAGDRPVFVNSDSEKGEIYVVLDDGTKGKKTFGKDGKPSYVSIERNGMKPKGAESFLKSLISGEQINPVSFISLSEKEQSEIILNTIPLHLSQEELLQMFGEIPIGIDINQHALKLCKELETVFYENRRNVNVEIKSVESDIASNKGKLPKGYNPEEWRNVKISDIVNQINDANKHNEYVSNCERLIEQSESQKSNVDTTANSQISIEQAQIDRIKQEIKEIGIRAVEDKKVIDEKASKAKEWLSQNKKVSTDELQTKLADTEAMKALVPISDDLKQKSELLAGKQNKSESLSKKILLARSKPVELLKSASMPIEGLGIDDNGNISINGRPIKNLSDGEKIYFALNIAKATAGELKLILIDGFEKLSISSQKAFIESVKDDGYQYIITCVTEGNLNIVTGEAKANA